MEVKTIDGRGCGMGDLVVGLWIAEGARAQGEPIYFVDGAWSDIVRAFGHETVPEPSSDCMGLGSGTRTFDEELRTSSTDSSPRPIRWQRTQGWNFEPLRPTLGPLPDEAVEWAKAMTEGRPTAILAPKANFQSRSMPLQKWLRVAWALHSEGIRTITVDGSKENVEAFPIYAFGFGWYHVIALLAQSEVVAGNDSGIPHLAATIGIPTFVTMGPTNSDIVFGHCFDQITQIATDTVKCVGCHFSGAKGYAVACDHGCEALQTIPWQAVYGAIREIVDCRTEAIA